MARVSGDTDSPFTLTYAVVRGNSDLALTAMQYRAVKNGS